ncbi:MAG: hypothetical protein GY859_13265 [Desulfobacterales bacterium]|nr:hypothetical protein [Desulfobacterales bacterium]
MGPESGPLERTGYTLCHFVEDFKETPAGPAPRVKAVLDRADLLGAFKVRIGVGRNNYKVTPGLYCVGDPGPGAPVLVTANYKLSFDALRKELQGRDAWILTLETRGINVWCAAGKKTFSTEELIRRIKASGLEKVVDHRELILPQLSATGVSARLVKKGSGFTVVWGPVRASDIGQFLDAGKKAEPAMRRVTFSFTERLVLAPLELSHVVKYLPWILAGAFLVSGIGSTIFSLHAAWLRGGMLLLAIMAGVLSGTIAFPLLLPWLPTRAFSLKGAIAGGVAAVAVIVLLIGRVAVLEGFALFLLTTAISSYLAMNFTGATPFTSPSGVEKEMRASIPFQAVATLLAAAAWVAAGFQI